MCWACVCLACAGSCLAFDSPRGLHKGLHKGMHIMQQGLHNMHAIGSCLVFDSPGVLPKGLA